MEKRTITQELREGTITQRNMSASEARGHIARAAEEFAAGLISYADMSAAQNSIAVRGGLARWNAHGTAIVWL